MDANQIQLLIIEDSDDDAVLLVDFLQRGGYRIEWSRVQDREALRAALERHWDVVLCDYSMPGFDGLSALREVRESNPDLPLIFVSGTIGEERAVEAMRQGARDYVLKDNLTRLVPVLRRELDEAERRREQRLQAAERQLVERERARLAAVLDATPDLVAIADLDGRVSYLNDAGRRLLGWTGDAGPQGSRLHDLFSEPVASYLLDEAFPAACRDGHWLGEIAMATSGSVEKVPFSKLIVTRRDEQDRVDCLALVGRDISERKRFEAELHHQATHDRLTGLPNRFLLADRLEAVLAHARRHGEMAAVLFFDLDNFKRINDSLGHAAGDAVLRQVAARMQSSLRPTDTVARYGGDEFTIVVGDLGRMEDLLAVLRKVRMSFAMPVDAGTQEVFVSFSIGIALSPFDGATSDTLLRNADTAMFRAKAAGRNQYSFYAASMNERGHELLTLEAELRGALEREEFELFYQPQIELASDRIVGFEALLRWRHPQRGLMAPAEFLPLLEDTGLIVPVGEWVLRRACIDARRWREVDGRLVRMSVNVSPLQFSDPDLPGRVARILSDEQVPHGMLELEVTENLMMRDPRLTSRTLRQLKGLGVRVAVDDFGVGYSSLAYLKDFPLDVLKIDRAFVGDVIEDSANATIVEAAISLGHKLGLGIVAEGVETADQLDFLRGVGCDVGQGYYFGHPRPVGEVEQQYAQGWR